MITDDIRNKLSSLDAFLAAETDDIDLAIKKLTDHSDPESIRRRIVLLLKAERFSEAHSITTTYSPHSEWIEVGIRAAVLDNDYQLAEKFVSKSETLDDLSGTLRLRSVIAFTDSIIVKHFSLRSGEQNQISMYAVEPIMQPALQKGVGFLIPYCEAIYDRHSISSPLEGEALTILQICFVLLERSEETKRFIPILINKGNINVLLGQFMAENRLPLTIGFADALIESNPDDFYALLFAEIIRQESGYDLQTVFTNLASLKTQADDKDKRAILFSALSGVSAQGGDLYIKEMETFANSLLDLNDPRHNTRLAIHKIYHKSWGEAETILVNNPLPNEPQWLKASAQCEIAKDKKNEGASKLITAALICKDETLLLEAAERAFKQEIFNRGIDCLECIRDYYPWNSYARKNLVTLYISEDLLDKAISENEHLITILPDDKKLLVQLAHLYTRVDKADKAITMLTDLNESGETTLDSILLLSSLLSQSENATKGFQLLEKNKEKYWDQKEFLFAYLNMGYASGNERQANESLQALNTLREKGEIDPKLFRMASLDELTDVMQESKERKKKIDEALQQGKMSWTTSAEILYKTIYFNWKVRTQKLKWLAEDVASRTEFSVYCTNGFGTDISDGNPRLVEISSTKSYDSICVDYSALVTLYALGKLTLLFSTFDNIYLSEKYRSNRQKDRQQLQPHQISHLKGYEAIRFFVDNNDITIVKNDDVTKYLIIDEYFDDKENRNKTIRSLKPVLDCLFLSGKIQKSKEKELGELSNRADSDSESQLSLNDQIVIELNTLMTIYRGGILETLVNSFKVYITENDQNEIVRDIQGFGISKKTLEEYNELWSEISNNPNIQYINPQYDRGYEDDNVRGVSLLSLKISQDKELPLLVDDRVLQTVIINGRGKPDGTAFGTDAFLRDALENKKIEISDYTSSIIQLMKWRYRFIVPNAEMLHYLATCYTGTSPGEELGIVAQYIHDCMRDPGLFGGLENTDPPISMALRFYVTWASRIGEFLALVWTDASITDERSGAITEWVAHIMLPNVPIVVQEQFHSRVASNLAEIIIVNALIRAAEKQSHARVPGSLRDLSRMVGIKDYRHEQLISEVISRAAG